MAKFLEKIFSVTNEHKNNRKYKVVNVLGIKFKKGQMSKFDKINTEKYHRELTLEEKRYYLQYQFKNALGKNLDLDNPKTFNEKIQWLKLYDDNPLKTTCADKYKVRDYVKDKIGEEYLIPLLGVYDNPDEIDFDSLPNQFVLKVNWGSGQNIIVKDKSKLNIQQVKEKLINWLKPESNLYYLWLEWCYKNIEPKIICEEYINPTSSNVEYQFFCFNGNIEFILTEINGKYSDNWQRGVYTENWEKENFSISDLPEMEISKPVYLESLCEKVKILAKDFSFVRIDFFDMNGEPKLREMTFYSGNGMSKFKPAEYNEILGAKLKLPIKKYYIQEYSKKYYTKYEDDCERKEPLTAKLVGKGIILPAVEKFENNEYIYYGGVLDSNMQFVKESANIRYVRPKSLVDGYAINSTPKYCDETVIYGGVLYEFYGHVLLETLSRLWYYYKSNPNKYRVVFNVVPRARGKFKEFFELLDIPYNDDTFITEPTQYKKVIVPELASEYATNWHKDFLIPYEYMKSKVKAEKYDKIYFTRTKLVDRNPVYGEKAIEKLFEKNGYKVFSPEKLSLKKQIALMKGCKSLATVSSSTYHNLMFAENNVELISLNRAFQPGFSQRIVNQAKELKYTYIDVSLNPYPVSHQDGPWIIGYTTELNNFMKDKGLKPLKSSEINQISLSDFRKFLREWAVRNKNKEFIAEEFKICACRFNIKFKRNFAQICCRILANFTFGKMQKRLKAFSRGE